MIFIHTRISDSTTIELLKWLSYFEKPFFRFNVIEDIYCGLFYDYQTDNLRWKNLFEEKIRQEDITSFYFNGGSYFSYLSKSNIPNLNKQANNYLSEETKSIVQALIFNDKKKIFGYPSFSELKHSKLSTLLLAKNIGLEIPDTRIVTSKIDLIELKRNWRRIITKAIENGINIHTEDYIIDGQRTEEVTDEVIEKMDDEFAPSLIQKLIDKQFEVRVFVYGSIVYSLAIFSQNDKLTEIDWRNSGNQTFNRELPFKLPADIEKMIKTLVQQLKLNYASIDLIYDKSGKFIFLEANPYGQYGFVSFSGNYFIERELAKFLN